MRNYFQQQLVAAVAAVSVMIAVSAPRPVRADGPAKPPAEASVAGPAGVSVVVRMQGPYDADVPLQVVCFFKYTPTGVKRLSGAPVELDKRLGGLVGSLRERGEFPGDDLETLLLDVPDGAIKPKRLLLIGLGEEKALSLDKLERVGKAGLREAVKLGAAKVAFAPLVRDQGNDQFGAGEVETAVTRGVLLAYDTERRLQKQGFAKSYALEQWVVEAGPAYFDDTVAGVKKAVSQAGDAVRGRDDKPYSTKSK